MSQISQTTTSRVWSCGTLNDGIDQLLAQQDAIDEEELALEKLIKDHGISNSDCPFVARHHGYQCPVYSSS